MGARAARFLQEDAQRAMKAAIRSGARDFRVDIMPDGTISIVVGAAARITNLRNSCDDLLE